MVCDDIDVDLSNLLFKPLLNFLAFAFLLSSDHQLLSEILCKFYQYNMNDVYLAFMNNVPCQ